MKPLSATNIATRFHLDCDLYLHTIYHQRGTVATEPSDLTKANFKRGLDWEQSCLLPFLDRQNLLLTIPSSPADGNILRANIEADDREHFFVAGLEFWPPQELTQRFLDGGIEPVHFGLGKPDLLEITRGPHGATWRVIDVKASKAVKTPHHVQIYFYTLCLLYILRNPFFRQAGSAGIWLPPAHGFDATTIPSLRDVRTIPTDLLAPSLDQFLFHRLPEILSLPHDTVDWHLNPLCRGCPFRSNCKQRTTENGELGTIPNISLAQAGTIRFLLAALRKDSVAGSDIEDLHLLLSDTATTATSFPVTLKRVKRMLAVQPMSHFSPITEAARTKTIQVIPRCSFTCPRREDIAIVISCIIDPSTSQEEIAYFCITVFSSISSFQNKSAYGHGHVFIPTLSGILRDILALNAALEPLPLTQFYVFSAAEHGAIHAHLIRSALRSTSSSNEDLRLCIGALAQGASLLQTTFQPSLLSNALLAFMAKDHRSKSELQTCLEHMDLPASGTLQELRQRISDEIRRLQTEGVRTDGTNGQGAELGQLPRVVILKKEIEHLLALPIPGWWDLAECAHTLLSPSSPYRNCPTDESLFAMYNDREYPEALHGRLEHRNKSIYAVLCDTRTRVVESGTSLLVNDAKVLTAKFMDICKNTILRKLFFMQQFEVLAKLSDLWKARIEGCPDAPVIEYRETLWEANGPKQVFYLVSGGLEMSAGQKEATFYDYIITEDENIPGNIPVEALYYDLGVSGIRFPLSQHHRSKWTEQNPIVQQKLLVADFLDIQVDGDRTRVTLQTWGGATLIVGRHYRLSPRLVDFNTSKVLSTLLDLDMQVTASPGGHGNIPFLQLVLEPGSFGHNADFDKHGKELVVMEVASQNLMRNLTNIQSIAGALVLKPSQQRAVHHILSNRLSIVWGPPGTGKTYTIALALLRLLHAQQQLGDTRCKIVFMTAVTQVAVKAFLSRLSYLLNCYRSIDSLPTNWLRSISIEHVLNGNTHMAPSTDNPSATALYAGTVYQLYNFSKRHSFEVDMCIIDEGSQLILNSAALVLRSLNSTARVIVAGDPEQLSPILAVRYPAFDNVLLFGSILDCLANIGSPESDLLRSSAPNAVMQLTENFRLNQDLAEFVSTIYTTAFESQNVQDKQLATKLKSIELDIHNDQRTQGQVLCEARRFLLALSNVMMQKPQTILSHPRITFDHKENLAPPSFSLALVRLETKSKQVGDVGFEAHVRGEAALAAALVFSIQRCSPGEDIFVATPRRIQRHAVNAALLHAQDSFLATKSETIGVHESTERLTGGTVTVDTIERLQGSEAAFVICLFSLPPMPSADPSFLLERKRLNVAISRAKTLCILITSSTILRPPIHVLANEDSQKGYAFLRAFEDRAWSSTISLDIDNI